MAEHSTERVLAEGVQEVRGTDDGLLKLIADGSVEKPALSLYADWLAWRKASETRPSRTVDTRTSTSQEEAALWRGTMAALYGDTWRTDLTVKLEEAAVAAQEAKGDDSEDDTPGRPRGLAAASASGPPAAGAEAGQGLLALPAPPLAGPSAGSSGGSSGQVTPTGLKRILEQEFDPSKETKDQWQSKLLRGVARLERLGHPVSEEELEKLIVKGKYAEEVAGLNLSAQVGRLKTLFGEVLLSEGTYEEREYNARLGALMEMLRARGTQPSGSVHKLFSSTGTALASLEQSPERPGHEAAKPRPMTVEMTTGTPPRENEVVRSLREDLDRLRRDFNTRTPGAASHGEAAEGALAQAISVQTEAIRAALQSKDQKHSVVKITPTFRWPILGDDGPDAKEVEDFYEKYEDLCRLANDGRGMNPKEHLTTLASCLRGSKEKRYTS